MGGLSLMHHNQGNMRSSFIIHCITAREYVAILSYICFCFGNLYIKIKSLKTLEACIVNMGT